MKQYVLKNLAEDFIDETMDIKELNSSLVLFNYIKGLIIRASQISRAQVMFDIYKVIKNK